MKRKKRRKLRKPFFKKKSFWFLFLVLISSSFLFYFSLFSSHFQVKETSISGIQTIQEDKLLKNFKSNATISLNILGNNLTSESLFIPSQGKISTLLESFPEIENINIRKDFFTKKITIEVKEKIPICIWCTKDVCVLLDKNATFIKNHEQELGFIRINEYADYNENLKLWSNKSKQDFILTLLTIYKNNNDIKEFNIYTDKFTGVYKNIDFIFSPKESIDWQIQKMNIVLKKLNHNVKSLTYIDLRFGEQVIIK